MSLKEELMKAIGAHGQWKMRLRTALAAEPLTCQSLWPKQKTNANSASGYSRNMQRTSRRTRVRKLHAEFHTIAGRVVELAVSGKGPEAERLMSDTGEFTVASSHLTEAIMAWKNGG